MSSIQVRAIGVALLLAASCGERGESDRTGTGQGGHTVLGTGGGAAGGTQTAGEAGASEDSGAPDIGDRGGTAGTGDTAAKSGAAGAMGKAGAGSGAGAAGEAGDSGASGAAGAGATGGGNAGAPMDACATQRPTCPTQPGALRQGGGLLAADRCAFPVQDSGFASYAPLVTAIEKLVTPVSIATVLANVNRSATKTTAPGGPAGVKRAFAWSSGDEDVAYWIPQGISGSPDASAAGTIGGKKVVLVSWYYDQANDPGSTINKGARIAFVDATNPDDVQYRFALLVQPKGTAAAPDFGAVTIHAGGIAWVNDYLYVVDTNNGLRVFDLTRIWKVSTNEDTIGCAGGTCRAATYLYAIPQIGAYADRSSCGPIYSFVSLDRTTTPPSLLSGEYCSTTACSGPLAGRIFRFPLGTNGLIPAGKTWPSEVYWMGQVQVQGAASHDGRYFLSSSKPTDGSGVLYRVAVGKSKASTWIDSPEDPMIDGGSLLWSLSEARGNRVVLGASLSSYPPP